MTDNPWRAKLRGVQTLVLALAVVVLGGSASKPRRAAVAVSDTLAFRGVTVVDVRDGRLLPDQTVVIVGNRIRSIGPARRVRVPAGAKLVDAREKYLIPGLWDMHVHQQCYWDVAQPLLIANGVTGVREAYTPYLDSLLQLRRLIAAGRRVGPRQVVAGAAILPYGDGPALAPDCRNPEGPRIQHQIWIGSVSTVRTRAQHVVDSLKAAGADFIKSRISGHFDSVPDWTTDSIQGERDLYFAIAAAARQAGIPFEGHLPSGVVTPAEASDAGQRILDHEIGQGICVRTPNVSDSSRSDTVSFAACQRLAQRLRRHGTWFMQNFTLCYEDGDTTAATWGLPPDTSVISANLRRFEGSDFPHGGWELVGRANVPLLAGTDLFGVGRCFGAAVHTALAGYQWLGLTPLQALQTATLNPALVYHATDSLGTVAPGKLADLVLLDANPLQDVYNTTKIRAVVANGRYFDRAALDSLRMQARRARLSSP